MHRGPIPIHPTSSHREILRFRSKETQVVTHPKEIPQLTEEDEEKEDKDAEDVKTKLSPAVCLHHLM